MIARTTLGDELTVSAQGLGCMGMSEYYGPSDWETSIATIEHAIDLGVTLFDTADQYGSGHNEVLVGRGIAGRRDDVVIATKFGIDRSAGDDARVLRGDRAYVLRSCEASLTRLGVDVIDLYYLHRPPENVPIEETVGAMAELVRAGKVRHLGLSEVDEPLLRRAAAVHPVAAVQSEYSLWERGVEALAPAMAELGVGLVPYSPLGRGFLTGTVHAGGFTGADVRSRIPRFRGSAAQANRAIADAVSRLASDRGATAAQLALAWVGAQSQRLGIPVVPIPGTRRPERLEENLGALDLHLSRAETEHLSELASGVEGDRLPQHGGARGARRHPPRSPPGGRATAAPQ